MNPVSIAIDDGKKRVWLCWLILLTVSLSLLACGGESSSPKPTGQYQAGSKSQDDVESLLKADSRVENFETAGNTLTVNVNQSFTSAPYGMQQRALWNWYNTWQAAQ